MSQQDLHDADVDALLEQLGGEAVTQGVRLEVFVKETCVARVVERFPKGRKRNVRGAVAAGEEPRGVAMRLPHLTQHSEHRFGERQGTLLVAFAYQTQQHLPGIDRRERQPSSFAQTESASVHRGQTSAIDRVADCRDQLAAVGITAGIRQTLLTREADFFLVNSGQS